MKQSTYYIPPLWCRNGHIQTILPSVARKIQGVHYQRERIQTPDDDFLDIDWSKVGGKALAILSHGLEGSTDRAYIQGMVKALNAIQLDCLAWNYRGCSGEINRQFRLYHNGCTDDLDLVIQHGINAGYDQIILIGFSMGGNISLLYAGQQGEQIPSQVSGVLGFSVPVDLTDCSYQMAKPANVIYMKRFLRMLHGKVKEKSKGFPELISDKGYDKIKDFKAFDDRYTAPMHGFSSAEDYWTRCSSKPLLKNITIPTLIVNALDDPFLGDSCYPNNQIDYPLIQWESPKYGGHVGFMMQSVNGPYWSETRAVEFIKTIIRTH